MASRALLRASDADRDAAAERLRTAAAEGRLDTDELDERLDVALRARTYGELDRLLVDLPANLPARSRVLPAARSALAIALPILMTLAVVAAVVVVAAVAAAWWILWGLVWLLMCGGRGCTMRPVRTRGMQRTRPAGLH